MSQSILEPALSQASLARIAAVLARAMNALARCGLYALIILPPLALGGAPEWAKVLIQWTALTSASALILAKILDAGPDRLMAPWIPTPLDWPMAALAALCLVSTVFSMHRPASFQALALLASYATVFHLAVHAAASRDSLKTLTQMLAAIGGLLAVLGLFKYFGANPFSWWDYNQTPHASRLTSTYYNADHMAGFLELTLPMAVGLTMAGFSPSRRLLWGLAGCFMAAALVLTLSRGGWLGALAALGFMGAVLARRRYFRKGNVLIAATSILVVTLMVILGSTPAVERVLTAHQGAEMASFASRVTVWRATLSMIAAHPWTGAGPGAYALVFTQFQPPGFAVRFFHAHNDYLHWIAETGILLAPVLLWFLAALAKQARAKINNPSRLVRGTTLGASASFIALAIHSAGDFNLHLPANALILAVLAGIVAAPVKQRKRLNR